MNLLLFRHSNVKQTKGNRSQLWACLVCMLNAVHISATLPLLSATLRERNFPGGPSPNKMRTYPIAREPITYITTFCSFLTMVFYGR